MATLAALAGPGAAAAADGLKPAKEVGAALEQTAAQTSDATQGANAQAGAAQTGATNVAAPTVVASSGAETTVVQENGAGAASSAVNTSETMQAASQAQTGTTQGATAQAGAAPTGDAAAAAPTGDAAAAAPTGAAAAAAPTGDAAAAAPTGDAAAAAPTADASAASTSLSQDAAPSKDSQPDGKQPVAAGGQSAGGQSATQASTTTQGAGAQATVVQTQPVNVAIPIVIGSPGAKTIVNQSNNASAKANTKNSSLVKQVIDQVQKGMGASSGGGAGQAGSGTSVGGGINQIIDTVVGGSSPTMIWIWNWDWDTNVNFPPVPSPTNVPGATPPGSWFPGDGDPLSPAFTRDDGTTNAAGPGHGVDEGMRAARTGSPAVPLAASTAPAEELPPNPLLPASNWYTDDEIVSSNFVQNGAAKPAAKPLPGILLPSVPGQAAPSGSAGGGIAPITLVVGALLALALQLSSVAGLLGRRLSLASVGWRRQAYLTPLTPPG